MNDQYRQAIIQKLMGGMGNASNPASGMMSGIGSIFGGLMAHKQNQGQFPAAPGGAKPNFATGLMNFFGRGGGLK